MSILEIELTPEIERALKARANEKGTTPELLALHDLTELYASAALPDPFKGRTLADVLAGHIGTIRSSEHTGIKVSYLSEDEESSKHWVVD